MQLKNLSYGQYTTAEQLTPYLSLQLLSRPLRNGYKPEVCMYTHYLYPTVIWLFLGYGSISFTLVRPSSFGHLQLTQICMFSNFQLYISRLCPLLSKCLFRNASSRRTSVQHTLIHRLFQFNTNYNVQESASSSYFSFSLMNILIHICSLTWDFFLCTLMINFH